MMSTTVRKKLGSGKWGDATKNEPASDFIATSQGTEARKGCLHYSQFLGSGNLFLSGCKLAACVELIKSSLAKLCQRFPGSGRLLEEVGFSWAEGEYHEAFFRPSGYNRLVVLFPGDVKNANHAQILVT
jgi:hypothetical protein